MAINIYLTPCGGGSGGESDGGGGESDGGGGEDGGIGGGGGSSGGSGGAVSKSLVTRAVSFHGNDRWPQRGLALWGVHDVVS